MFMNSMKETLNEGEFNTNVSENGAIGFRTTGKELLDLNFAVASLRSANENDIVNRFMKAYYEDPITALKWLFFARDVRGGLGERRLFRVIFKYLSDNNPEIAYNLIELIPEYGRIDDLLILLDTSQKDKIISFLYSQLSQDMKKMDSNEPISLTSKWLPSINTSSKETRRYARILTKAFGMTEKVYRKTLSKMRSYINVTEVNMSKNEWDKINYETVPSKANLIYNGAFLRHDEERRREFLGKLDKGEAKINSSVLYPHDIVHSYCRDGYSKSLKEYDSALEAMWKSLPDIVQGNDNTIVVADGSGSMCSTIGDTEVTALNVANALAIYFAERSSGQFKDNYITFSHRPQLVNFSKAHSLKEKIEIASRYNEIADTNIEAVFNLILKTAIDKNMEQSELPTNILIISDMEFNSCVTNSNERLFSAISKKYVEHGYKIPRIVFWNVNSRSGTIPVKENDLGVALVSGFSVNIAKMVMSGKLDPYECLLETLNSDRYKAIEEALI